MSIKIVRHRQDLGKYNAIYLPTKKDKKGIIKIVKHKSSDSPSSKPIIRDLDAGLTDTIKDFIKKSSQNGKFREYLFQDRDGKAFSSSAFSHKFQRLFLKRLGVAFSSTTLRKIFWTDTYGGNNKEIKKKEMQMQESADQMGHQLPTVRKYYIANDE
jgi:hypothetical protein